MERRILAWCEFLVITACVVVIGLGLEVWARTARREDEF